MVSSQGSLRSARLVQSLPINSTMKDPPRVEQSRLAGSLKPNNSFLPAKRSYFDRRINRDRKPDQNNELSNIQEADGTIEEHNMSDEFKLETLSKRQHVSQNP